MLEGLGFKWIKQVPAVYSTRNMNPYEKNNGYSSSEFNQYTQRENRNKLAMI